MLKREVWNNAFTPPWRNLRLLLFALAIMMISSSVGELKKTQGQSTSICNINYRLTTQWNVGFQVEVTITNNGPAINGWNVAWTFPTTTQVIYELWNGVYTQTGQNVTVRNASYNANIPTGGRVVFGFNANWSGSNPPPTSFTLNGQICGATGPVIQTSVTTLSVNEGSSAQFGVRLSAAPASNVTVNVARLSGDADLTVTGAANPLPDDHGQQHAVLQGPVGDHHAAARPSIGDHRPARDRNASRAFYGHSTVVGDQ